MKSEKIYSDKTKWRLFSDNLVGGIGWGIGTILGASALLVLFSFFVARVQTIPYLGEFVYNVVREVQRLEGR